jgi:Fe-S cluster assembly protein SufD
MLAAQSHGPLADLNTASFHDGVVVHLAAGTVMETPLHIISVGAAVDHPVDFHPRIVVVLEDGAQATIVESHCGVVDQPYLSNGVVEIRLGAGARLRHVKLQDEAPEGWHVALHAVTLAEDAFYHATVLHTGSRLARHEARVRLSGARAEARLDGAIIADGTSHLDDTILVAHDAPHCTSRQLWKSVLDGKARGVFQGKVRVARGAVKTDAHQLSRALLLSPQAEADGKPELEIYADDVKCGHGSAIGALDDDALFYLTSRGIDRRQARRMLIEAFIGEVVDGIEDPAVRQAVAGLVGRRLGGLEA